MDESGFQKSAKGLIVVIVMKLTALQSGGNRIWE